MQAQQSCPVGKPEIVIYVHLWNKNSNSAARAGRQYPNTPQIDKKVYRIEGALETLII